MKYIQLEYAGYILFEQSQSHEGIANKFPNDTVISAGFVSQYDVKSDQVSCFGESQTLILSPAPGDSDFIHRRLTSY